MKIFKSVPNDSTQWRSDSPSVKAMRAILPVAAILSAVSLAGGLSSFLGLDLSTNLHLIITAALVVGAFFFDALGISSARSVVRDFILSSGRAPDPEEAIERDTLFWVSVSLAAVIAAAVVLGSFRASQDGIRYLVLEYRKAQELRTETDTILTATVAGATDQNAAILEAKREAYEAQRAAMVAAWDGKIKAVTVEIGRRQKQRTTANFQYIDNLVSKLEKQRAELEGKKGEALAGLAAGFADEQARLLATTETLTAVTVTDAEEASARRKKKQEEKDRQDTKLSNLVSAIFSWSIVLMLVIGVRLELLEVRNGILPNPILSNGDLSGLEDLRRFVFALPAFIFSWIRYGAEMLYIWSAKKRAPVVDNDLVNYSAAQIEVQAIRKEGKIRHLPGPPAERRAIGYGQAGKPGTDTANDLDTLSAKNKPDSTQPSDEEKKAIVNQIKLTKRELRKYKKRQSSSYQKILASERKGEEPRAQTVQAYENRTEWVNRLTAEIQELESKLNSLN